MRRGRHRSSAGHVRRSRDLAQVRLAHGETDLRLRYLVEAETQSDDSPD
jgi:hypothetical protein